jgi:hypothetical protein
MAVQKVAFIPKCVECDSVWLRADDSRWQLHEVDIPTVQPGETIHKGNGRKLLVLGAVYDLPGGSPYRGFLTVEDRAP